MIFVSILLMKNLHQVRSRVRPHDCTSRLTRRDTKLMKIVFIEVIVCVLCTFSHPLMLIYTSITNNMVPNKTAERRQIELFTSFITMSLLLYLNYNTTFYVHSLTSKAYRMEVKQLILKLIEKARGIQQNVPRIVNQIRVRQQLHATSAV
jgi:hypothetical protein